MHQKMLLGVATVKVNSRAVIEQNMYIEIIVFWVVLGQFRQIGDICDFPVGPSHILGGTMRDFKKESHLSTESPD
jgi:hypothetical protein